MRFDRLRHPVSMSPILRHGQSVGELQRMGRFEREARAYALLYSALSLDPVTDLSEALEAEIARLGGDAVVDPRIETSACTANHVLLLNLLPIWPSCVHVRATGTVVRARDTQVGERPLGAAPDPRAGSGR